MKLLPLVMMVMLHTAASAHESDRFVTRVLLPPGLPQMYVRQAIHGARERLEDPACLRVLDDFTDERGARLSIDLERLHQAATARLSDLVFVDGIDEPACEDESVAAFTTLRGRVVYVCSGRFATPQDPLTGVAGDILVIHEFLHSLGLPESPSTPDALTSVQITDRVWDRCGDVPRSDERHRHNSVAGSGPETKTLIRQPPTPGLPR